MKKKYTLISDIQNCPPCRTLSIKLDQMFPEWKDYIDYESINIKNGEGFAAREKYPSMMGVPTFIDNDTLDVARIPWSSDELFEQFISELRAK